MLVRFRRQGATLWQYTTAKPCTPGQALNFYVGGLRANTTYVVQHQVLTGSQSLLGPEMTYQSGVPSVTLPTMTVDTPPGPSTSYGESTVLQSIIGNSPSAFPVATDLSGEAICTIRCPTTR